jgi:hypothetical protein
MCLLLSDGQELGKGRSQDSAMKRKNRGVVFSTTRFVRGANNDDVRLFVFQD